jgi:integrase
MFEEYRQICQLMADKFGKDRPVDDLAADDFESLRADMAERWGPVRLGNAITRVRTVFKYGFENGLIEKPIRFGSEFRRPDKAVLRRHRAKNGEKMLEAEQLRQLIEAADVPLRAMIYLGVNCGFGNNDVATLPQSALDLDGGWLNFPRPKTGIPRRCPLWPEAIAILRQAIAERPHPKDSGDAGLVFINARGYPWVRMTDKSRTDTVSPQFGELLKRLDLRREGLGFYSLRHIHRTVADGAKDPVACDTIMGHADPTMGGHYRERIDDSRLVAVAEHVRRWLLGEPKAGAGDNQDASKPPAPKTRKRPRKSKPEPTSVGAGSPTLRLYVG